RRRAGRGFSGVCRARLRGEDAVVHAREPQEWDPAVGEPLQPLMEPDVPSVPEEFETEEGEGPEADRPALLLLQPGRADQLIESRRIVDVGQDAERAPADALEDLLQLTLERVDQHRVVAGIEDEVQAGTVVGRDDERAAGTEDPRDLPERSLGRVQPG